jgi:hypothetical protein
MNFTGDSSTATVSRGTRHRDMPTRSDAVAEKLAGGYANLFSNTNIFNE